MNYGPKSVAKILGIDPGQKGALAFLNEHGLIEEIEDMPLLGKEINAHLVARLVLGYGPVKQAVIERAHSMPKQGIVGAFNYGVGYGKLLGVLAALDIPIHLLLLDGVEAALASVQRQGSLSTEGHRTLAKVRRQLQEGAR